MPHRIRLRGPWEFEPLWRWVRGENGSWQESQADLLPGGSFIAPRRWSDVLGADFRGSIQLSRRFHRPTGLEAESKLWLVIGDLAWPTAVRLNEQSIAWINRDRETDEQAPHESSRVEIGSMIAPQNVLTLLVTAPPVAVDHSPTTSQVSDNSCDWLGQVWLEIE